jgi:hypothetical protein
MLLAISSSSKSFVIFSVSACNRFSSATTLERLSFKPGTYQSSGKFSQSNTKHYLACVSLHVLTPQHGIMLAVAHYCCLNAVVGQVVCTDIDQNFKSHCKYTDQITLYVKTSSPHLFPTTTDLQQLLGTFYSVLFGLTKSISPI